MSLLGVLVDKELAVRSKLKRLHDSQVRVTSWSCLTPDLSAYLKRNVNKLSAYLKLNVDDIALRDVDDIALRGGVTLPRVLAQPMLTRTASKSTVANIFNILLQTSRKAPTHSTRAIATSALGILRAVSASLGDGTGSRWESSPWQHLARTQSRSCPWHLRTMALATALARSIRPGSHFGLPPPGMATMLRAEKILVPAREAFGNLLGCMANPCLLTDPSAIGVLVASADVHDVRGPLSALNPELCAHAFAGGVMVDEIASENEALQVSDFIAGTNHHSAMLSMVATCDQPLNSQVLMFMRDDLSAAPCTSNACASTGLTTLRLLGMDGAWMLFEPFNM